MQFELYRYQILPKDRFFEGDLFDGIKTIDELEFLGKDGSINC